MKSVPPSGTTAKGAAASGASPGYAASALFVTAGAKGTFARNAKVPKSCIEGAEYILQCIANGKLHEWKEGATNTPHMIAEFGGAKSIDVSAAEAFQDQLDGLTAYEFKALPQVGQGLVVVNNGADDGGYNMHFGAVVARADDGSWCVLSNVAEEGKVALIDDWPMLKITDVNQFKTRNGYRKQKFVLGWLHV